MKNYLGKNKKIIVALLLATLLLTIVFAVSHNVLASSLINQTVANFDPSAYVSSTSVGVEDNSLISFAHGLVGWLLRLLGIIS